jgi:hypothetical protein
MARLLLDTQVLFDIAANRNLSPQRWFDAQRTQDEHFPDGVAVSALSVALINRHFRDLSLRNGRLTNDEDAHRENFVRLVHQFNLRNSILGVDYSAATIWIEKVEAIADGNGDIGFEDQLVYATVLAGNNGRPLTLVAEPNPVTQQLEIAVIDPYQS